MICTIVVAVLTVAQQGLKTGGGIQGNNTSAVVDLVSRVRAVVDPIENITYTLRVRQEPSPKFVSDYIGGSGRSAENVRSQFSYDSRRTFLETKQGSYFYSELRDVINESTSPVRIISSDQAYNVSLTNTREEGKTIGAMVHLNGNYLQQYLFSEPARGLMLPTVLPAAKNVWQEHSTAPIATLTRSNDSDVRLSAVFERGPALKERLTLTYDLNGPPALKGYLKEFRRETPDKWVVASEWVVQELANCEFEASGKKVCRYPSRFTTTTYGFDGSLTFTKAYVVESLSINRVIATNEFRPAIVDGSNVTDDRNGKITVYGSGPNPELKKILQRRIDETQSLVAGLKRRGVLSPATAPTGWAQSVPWFLAGLGAFGLLAVVAVVLRRKLTG